MSIKIILTLALILALSPGFAFAIDNNMAEKISQDREAIFASFENIQQSSERQEEICKYKSIFENLAPENIKDEVTAKYDEGGNLRALTFSDNLGASYTYSYGSEEQLEAVSIKYGDTELALFTQTSEFFFSDYRNEEEPSDPTLPGTVENPDTPTEPTVDDKPTLPNFSALKDVYDNPEEISKYKTAFQDLTPGSIEGAILTYDEKGRLSTIQFSDNTIAIYDYAYNSDNKLMNTHIQYEDLILSLDMDGIITLSKKTGNTPGNNQGEETLNPDNKKGFLILARIDSRNERSINNYTDMRINLPVLKKAFDDFENNRNLLSDKLNKDVDAYYDTISSKLKENLSFWLDNLHNSSLENKVKNNTLNKKELREAIDLAVNNIAELKNNPNQLPEFIEFINLEKELKDKLLSEINIYEIQSEELLNNFYEQISRLLQEQNIPAIAENGEELNIIISLPELPEPEVNPHVIEGAKK